MLDKQLCELLKMTHYCIWSKIMVKLKQYAFEKEEQTDA